MDWDLLPVRRWTSWEASCFMSFLQPVWLMLCDINTMALFTQNIFWYFCICGYLLYHFNNVWDAADFACRLQKWKILFQLEWPPPPPPPPHTHTHTHSYQAMGLVLFFIQIMGDIKCHQAWKLIFVQIKAGPKEPCNLWFSNIIK